LTYSARKNKRERVQATARALPRTSGEDFRGRAGSKLALESKKIAFFVLKFQFFNKKFTLCEAFMDIFSKNFHKRVDKRGLVW
jgi:hypothetical protein